MLPGKLSGVNLCTVFGAWVADLSSKWKISSPISKHCGVFRYLCWAPSVLDESYESSCQGKIFPPPSPRGDGCGDWHPARFEIWRGFVFATCFSQTQAVVGFCSKVS
jgi:hypothetical protein